MFIIAIHRCKCNKTYGFVTIFGTYLQTYLLIFFFIYIEFMILHFSSVVDFAINVECNAECYVCCKRKILFILLSGMPRQAFSKVPVLIGLYPPFSLFELLLSCVFNKFSTLVCVLLEYHSIQ